MLLLSRHRALPKPWVMAALLLLAVGATVAQYGSIVGAEAGVALVVLLLALKTLELRARRDAMVVFFLGFFTLLTLFLQSQSLSVAAAMCMGVWGLLACLVNAHMPAGYPSVRQLLRTSGLLMLLGTPVMAVLFVTFPRLPPLWGLPTAQQQGRTGLSGDMTVGDVAQLAQDTSVALRLRLLDASFSTDLAMPLKYFRGPVLEQFDGRQWRAHPFAEQFSHRASSDADAVGLGPSIAYEITLEPHQQRWLLTPDATLAPPDLPANRVLSTPHLQWLSTRPITEVVRYQGQAHAHYQYGQQLPAQQRRRLQQLPGDLNPQTRAWAQRLRDTHGEDTQAIVQAALQHLRTGGYVYTLQPGVVTHPNTADAFWFEQRQGFCEHIASAFVVLMRAAGIPARIVTGYHGGERNPVDGLWTVRQSDAHAWSEVWTAEHGWLRIDPTTAVAPSRTEQLQRLAAPSTALNQAVQQWLPNATLQRMRASWEAMNHRWNHWILNYSPGDQRALLQRLGLDTLNWRRALIGMLGTAAGLLLLMAGLRWHQRRRADPWLHLLQQTQRRLQSFAVELPKHPTPTAMAAAVVKQWGDAGKPLQQWLQDMEQWRYAPHSANTASLASLRRRYRALPWPRHRTP